MIDLDRIQLQRADEQVAEVHLGHERPRRGRKRTVSDVVVRDIRRRRAAGESLQSIGLRYGLATGTVSKIGSRVSYVDVEDLP